MTGALTAMCWDNTPPPRQRLTKNHLPALPFRKKKKVGSSIRYLCAAPPLPKHSTSLPAPKEPSASPRAALLAIPHVHPAVPFRNAAFAFSLSSPTCPLHSEAPSPCASHSPCPSQPGAGAQRGKGETLEMFRKFPLNFAKRQLREMIWWQLAYAKSSSVKRKERDLANYRLVVSKQEN